MRGILISLAAIAGLCFALSGCSLLPGEVDPIRRRRSDRNLTEIHHPFNGDGEAPIDLPPERLSQPCLSFFRQARGGLLSRPVGQHDQRGSKRALHRKPGAC